MQFCTECGGALNLFESNDEKICWSCMRKKESRKPPPPVEPPAPESEELSEASFSCENDMLVLKAKEGWVLWSGPVSQPVTIGTIMKRARQIHRIRKKRQQNSG
jgi:hypothetical protein